MCFSANSSWILPGCDRRSLSVRSTRSSRTSFCKARTAPANQHIAQGQESVQTRGKNHPNSACMCVKSLHHRGHVHCLNERTLTSDLCRSPCPLNGRTLTAMPCTDQGRGAKHERLEKTNEKSLRSNVVRPSLTMRSEILHTHWLLQDTHSQIRSSSKIESKKRVPAHASPVCATDRACLRAAGVARIWVGMTLHERSSARVVSSCGKLCFRLGEQSLQKKRPSRLSCHSVKVSCAQVASASAPASCPGKRPVRSFSGYAIPVAENGKARAMRALVPLLEQAT